MFDEDKYLKEALAVRIEKAFLNKTPKSAKEAAVLTYDVLRRMAREAGYDPDIEVVLHNPEQALRSRGSKCYCVMWESGPYEWAISISMMLTILLGKVVEPHYSFDLCFYPEEWN